ATPATWQKLADLPFAAALTRGPAELAAGEQYDGVHFDQAELAGPDASGSQFLECALTRLTLSDGRLTQARFADVWLQDVRLISTGLARTSWRDVTFAGAVIAGAEAFGSLLRRVRFDRCKLDSVNFRDSDLTDVTFDNCVLRDVDFSSARLTRVTFPGSRLAATTLVKVTLDQVDLRGAAELGLTVDPAALGGAIVSTAQLLQLAPLLADSIGIVVTDQ
ncbi:MAG TPA: pentapeptide repeat-containing protein, partial [Streptosporangiaceae bacterium]|nr:pentapeptide repeat-containing protein [Streptosporangiaceae bacterium]